MRIYRSAFVAAAVAILAGAAACGGDSAGGGTTPTGNGNNTTPTSVTVVSAPGISGAVGAAGGTFTVKVTNSAGTGLPNINVSFSATGSATVSPASAVTDASGQASTQVTLGTAAGSASVRANATGVATGVTSAITVIAGPASKIVVTPKTLRFLAVGDTARITAAAQDQFGNAAGASAITFSSSDPTLVTVDAAGLVRVVRQPGTTFVVSSAGGRSDTTVVTVLAVGASNCTGVATVTPMNVNDVQSFSGAQYGCFSGSTAGAEYTVVAFNSSTDPTNPLTASITGNGLGTAPSSYISPLSATALRSISGGVSLTPAKPMDDEFHLALMKEASARFRGGFARARLAKSAAASRSITPTSISSTGARNVSSIPVSAKVGDIITLNVSGGVCSNPVLHGLRVAAVGTKSVVLADTLNPTGGFTDTDYARFAARFDTLVYPLDVNAFGAPTDIDGDGKVAIIFTRTVNELVNQNSGYFVGGFFNPRDLFPKKGTTAADDCVGSNFGEMFYMVVPAPAGINGVTHTTGFVDSLTTGIIAHEFQHLISGSRRLYVNPGASDFEDPWLNEGLSHIAEELLFYRESGKSPRSNLGAAGLEFSPRGPTYAIWKMDQASNFSRFLSFLQDPGGNSPYADDDELATRGAAWSFLRYAADRLGTTDGTLWQRFDNSTQQGLQTLNTVLATDVTTLFRDWNIANYLDDYGSTSDPRFLHKSWNFRDLYPTVFINVNSYPLKVTPLADNTKTDLSVRGGSASYVRLSVPAGKEGLLTFTSGNGLPSAPFQFVVVRTK